MPGLDGRTPCPADPNGEAHAVADGQDDPAELRPRHEGQVELPQRGGAFPVRLGRGLLGRRSTPQHVVREDHAARAQLGHRDRQVLRVLLLHAVDVREIDRPIDQLRALGGEGIGLCSGTVPQVYVVACLQQ